MQFWALAQFIVTKKVLTKYLFGKIFFLYLFENKLLNIAASNIFLTENDAENLTYKDRSKRKLLLFLEIELLESLDYSMSVSYLNIEDLAQLSTRA